MNVALHKKQQNNTTRNTAKQTHCGGSQSFGAEDTEWKSDQVTK